MTKHHEITIQDLKGYTKDVVLASSFGNEYKSLMAHLDLDSSTITYKVMSHGEIVFDGYSLEKAINTYNSIC
jgi:hypothetical protein